MQAPHALAVDPVRARQRVDARLVQALVRVDVPHAGEELLVEQERLDPPAPLPQRAGQPLDAECGRERLGPEQGELRFGVRDVQEAPELAHVEEAQHAAAVEGELELDEAVARRARGLDVQPAGHAQVHEQRSGAAAVPGEVGHDELGPAPEVEDPRADDRAPELGRALPADRARPVDARRGDRAADELRTEQAHGGLDLGQLGHSGRDSTPGHNRIGAACAVGSSRCSSSPPWSLAAP